MQKVHWKIRADRDLACWAAARWVIGARLRRRRSPEEKELRDCADREDARVRSEAVEAECVSKEEIEGSRNMLKFVALPEEEFWRDGPRLWGSLLCWSESDDEAD